MRHIRFAPVILGVALLSSTGCSAADHDFNAVISGVEHRYATHARKVPMMGLVSFCARVATHGSVKGMRIAEFNSVGPDLDPESLLDMVRSKLGAEWQPVVTERATREAQLSVIFVRPAGRSLRMLIADYDHGELNVVRMELDGDELARFMHDPASQAHSSRHVDYTAKNAQ